VKASKLSGRGLVAEMMDQVQGGHQPGKPGKVRQFDGQETIGESGKSRGKCVLWQRRT